MYKIRFFIFTILWSFSLDAQNIITVASSGVYDPNDLMFDNNGNLYFTTLLGNQVKKMDTGGVITVVAGTGSAGFSGDGGPAIAAQLDQPCGIATDTVGNIFFADVMNQRVRKIDISTGIISTIAGKGPGGYSTGAYSGDGGLASAAALNCPSSICFDKTGNLYVADGLNRRIRKIDITGIINTIAGNGTHGSTGDDGPAFLAECSPNGDIHVDNTGNIYFTENGSSINKIRKINSLGIISKIAGDTSLYMYNGDDIPAHDAHLNPSFISFDSDNNIYISDTYNDRVRKIDGLGIIHTIAGNGVGSHSGDGFPAIDAEIWQPSGLAFDECGNLFIGEVGSPPYIRKVLFNPTCIPARVPETATPEPSIYPNPATSELNINGVSAVTNYAILNITGTIEQSGTLKEDNNSISVKSLTNGIHILKLIDYEGRKTVKKIIKE